jgi:hypothetical protein
MSSKKVKPLASLFQQWSSQQESSSQPPQSYRILLQCTNGLSTRIQAAEAVENPQLYQRAGVRTPAESAIRDGLGGYAWLEHLVDLALKSNHVVWIATKTQASPITSRLMSMSQHNNNTVTVIQAAVDPWSWDEDCIDSPSLKNLQELHTLVKERIQKHSNTVLVWESLTPLIAVHGFETSLRFLNSFDDCFQIWPIRIEALTPLQHQALEDASQALLNLQGGDMTMIRQGIRERGNIVRKTLPFRLDGGRLVELENEEERTTAKDHETNKDLVAAVVAESSSSSAKPQQQHGRVDTGSSRKIKLQLEEDDEPKTNIPPETSRPRIYLQEDDPEFVDMDEEDPDDDLDL